MDRDFRFLQTVSLGLFVNDLKMNRKPSNQKRSKDALTLDALFWLTYLSRNRKLSCERAGNNCDFAQQRIFYLSDETQD